MFSFRPEFFDIFGLFTFGFLTWVSLRTLTGGDPMPHWAVVILLLIGIGGLIVDGIIVYRTYIRK